MVSTVFNNVIQSKITSIKEIMKRYGLNVSIGAVVWLCGSMGLSFLWIIIGTVSYQYTAQNYLKKKEKLVDAVRSLHEQNNTSLPSWIYFPDVERAEWINRIIKQLWPSIQGYFKSIISESVEPSIRSSSGMLSSFKFTDMDLGSVTPEIVGIKVYSEEQTRHDEIVMDMQITFSSNCNFGISVNNYLSAGLCDLYFSGLMRVEMSPLISQSPFIGAIAVSFVNDPKIDFNLTELVNMFDIPGFDGLLRGGITESVRGIMVFPEKYVVKMVEGVDISALKYPMPEGVLRIHVLEARNLVAKDKKFLKKDSSDPYVVVKVGREFKKRTVTISEQLNPVWNDEA